MNTKNDNSQRPAIGSGAASGYAGREAGGGPDDVEERSQESAGVTPGEAGVEDVWVMLTFLASKNRDAFMELQKVHDKPDRTLLARSEAFHFAAKIVKDHLFPQPDSEATK